MDVRWPLFVFFSTGLSMWSACDVVKPRRDGDGEIGLPPSGEGPQYTADKGNESNTALPLVAPNAVCAQTGWCYDFPKPFPNALAVYAASPTQVWISDGSQLVYFDGATWTAQYEDDDVFNDLHGTSANDVWAVTQRGKIVHFDGIMWTFSFAAGQPLRTVWAVSSTNVYAGGSKGTVLHYDGKSWTTIVAPGNDNVRAIWAWQNRAWVALESADGKIASWDGHTWSNESLPEATAVVRALWGTSERDLWALAQPAKGSSGTTDFWHYSLSGWTRVHHVDKVLTSIQGLRQDDMWAVGPDTHVWHWDGMSWQQIGEKALGVTPPERLNFARVSVAAPDVAYFVGRGIVRHTGKVYQRLSEAAAVYPTDLWASSTTDIWVTTADGSILHRDANGWSVSTTAAGALRGISGTGPGDIWAVGDGGIALHYDGIQWNQVATGLNAILWYVHAISPTDVWTGGGDNHAHYNGSSWTTAPSPETGGQRMWASASNDVYLVGGGLSRWDGTKWETVTLPILPMGWSLRSIGLVDIHGDKNQLWIVGEEWLKDTAPY